MEHQTIVTALQLCLHLKNVTEETFKRWPFRQKQIDMLLRIGLLGLVQRQHLVFDSVFNDSKVKVGLQC